MLRTRNEQPSLWESFLPEVCDCVNWGMSERAIQMERDIWILLQSVAPEQAAAWAADKLDGIADAEFRAIYQEYDAAFDWSPDDPRLPGLAERTSCWFAARARGAGRTTPLLDPGLIRLVNECIADTLPAMGPPRPVRPGDRRT